MEGKGPIQPAENRIQVAKDKWSMATKIALVAAGVFAVIAVTFVTLHFTHKMDVWEFIYKKVPDFLRDPHANPLNRWEIAALGTLSVAGFAGIIAIGAGSYSLVKKIQDCRAQAQENKAAAAREQAQREEQRQQEEAARQADAARAQQQEADAARERAEQEAAWQQTENERKRIRDESVEKITRAQSKKAQKEKIKRQQVAEVRAREAAEAAAKAAIEAEVAAKKQQAEEAVAAVWREFVDNLTPKLMAFIHGDSFIKKSGYEGGNVVENTKFLLSQLKQRNDPALKNIIFLLEDFCNRTERHSISHVFDKRNLSSFIDKNANELSQKVRDLKEGERFIMQGGWASKGGGHAILYIIEKEADGSYAFSVINTGDGIETHASGVRGYKKKYKPIFRLHRIAKDKLANKAFFSSLLELQISTGLNGEELHHSAESVYQKLHILGGARDYDYEEQIDFITAQKSGTCSWKVLMKLLHVELGTETYKKLVFGLKEKTLQAFLEKKPHRPEEQRLLLLSSESFARYSLRQYEKGLITNEELERIEKLTSDVAKWVQEKEAESHGKEVRGQSLIFRADGLSHYRKVGNGLPELNPIPPPGEMITRRRLLESPIISNTFPDDIQEMNELLARVCDYCKKLSARGNHAAVVQIIADFIKCTPEGSLAENGYWSKCCANVDPRDITFMMERYRDLSQRLFDSICGLPETQRDSPEQMVLMNMLLATNLRLSTLMGSPWHFPRPGLLEWDVNPFAMLHDAKLRSTFDELKVFFTSQRVWNAEIILGFQEARNRGFALQFWDNGSLRTPAFSGDMEYLRKLVNEEAAKIPALAEKSDFEKFEVILPQLLDPQNRSAFSFLFQQVTLLLYIQKNAGLKKVSRREDVLSGTVKPRVVKVRGDLLVEIEIEGVNSYRDDADDHHRFANHQRPFLQEEYNQLFNGARDSKVGYAQRGSEILYYRKKQGNLSSYEAQSLSFLFFKKETVFPQLLSYLQENPDELTNRDFQLMVHNALYFDNLLIANKQLFPEIREKLFAYLNKQLEMYRISNDVVTQLYIIELQTLLSSPREFDAKEALQNVIKRIDTSTLSGQRLKALALTQYITLFYNQETLTDQEIIEISISYLHIRTYGYDEHFSYPHVKSEIEELIDRIAAASRLPQLQHEITARALHELFPMMNNEERERYRIDISGFVVLDGDLPIGGMPSTFTANPDFQSLFRTKSIAAREDSAGVYSFIVDNRHYRVFQSLENQKIIIQRKEEQEWSTLISKENMHSYIPESLVVGHEHWIRTYDGKNFMISVEKQGKSIASLTGKVNVGGEWVIQSCVRTPESAAAHGLMLNHPDDIMAKFQKKGFFLNWDNTIFEFPKAQISFKVENGKAYFSEDNRFFLSQVQKPPSTLSGYRGAIKLQDGNGKAFFLFPREPISFPKLGNQAMQGALHSEIHVDHIKNDGAYFQFEEREGVLVGNSVEENLFLAYLYLAHKNYKEAYRLLAPYASSHPRGYLEKEKEMIAWIFTMIDQAKDPSPAACAVHLQLLYLCQRNLSQEEKNQHKLNKRIAKTLNRYYPLAHHMPTLAPSPLQEIELLEASQDELMPSLQARYNYLKNVDKKELIFHEEENSAGLPLKKRGLSEINIREWAEVWDKIPKNEEFQARKSDFYFYGKERLKQMFLYQDPIGICLGDDDHKRKDMITELALLRFHGKEDKEIMKLRDLLLFIAENATPEQRKEGRESLPKGKLLDRLQALQDFAGRISEPKEEEEKGQEAKPLREVVIERRSERVAAFQPTHAPLIPRSMPSILKEDENMHPEEIPMLLRSNERLLGSLSSPANANKVMRKEYARVQNSVKEYAREQQEKRRWEFTQKQMQELQEFVQTRKEKIRTYAVGLREEILALANRLPEDPKVAVKEGLKRLGKQREVITIDQLIIFYLQNNGEEFAKRNPYLTNNEREHIANLLQSYMFNMTEVTYLTRLGNDVQEAVQDPGEENVGRVEATLREERAYDDPRVNKVMLIFEYYTGFRLRKEQVDLIIEMQQAQSGAEKSNIIKQLIMGSGKSKIILPLLSLLNSRGNNVPMIVVPDMLFETNIEDMRALLGEHFHHLTHTVELAEGEALTDEKLNDILDTIANIKAHRSYALLKASTAGFLLLHFKKAAIELGANDPPSAEAIKRFEKLQEIINTLFEEAIFDEADMILDYLKEMNFAIGNFQGMAAATIEIMEKMFTYIAKSPLAGFFQLQEESEEPFDNDKYEREVKPQLAEAVMTMLGIDLEQQEVREYLLTKSKGIPDSVQKAEPKIRSQLALSKKMISTFLPHIVGKNCNQHFGLSQKHSSFRAIPYDEKTKTPREKSEFSSPFMTMLYTTFYYARKGVTVSQIKRLMEECREQARTEYQAKEGDIDIKETQGYQRFAAFASLCGQDLFSIQESDLQTVVDEFNKDIERRIAFSKEFGWREVGFYDQQLTCGMQHLAWLFDIIMGFTGTLWNADTFPTKLTPETDSMTDGKTLQLLHDSQPEVRTLDVEGLYASLKEGKYHACIDVGAWFRGQSEREVALRMLENLPEKFKAIVYFNHVDIPPGTKGQAVIIERGKENEEPKLLSKSRIPMEDRFTYYSKTTGADITQYPHAKAITTIGKNMLLRDLLQGVWRLRELDKKQTTDFAISPELQRSMPNQGTLGDIFCLGIDNQALRQSNDNLGSLKKQIDFEGEAVVLDALKRLSAAEAARLSRAATHILAPTISMDPYELFGSVESEEETDEIIQATMGSAKQKMRVVYRDYPALSERVSEDALGAKINALVAAKRDALPERGRLEGSADPGMQMQIQQQAQMSQHTEMQLEVVQELQEGPLKPRLIHTWEMGNIFSEDYWKKRGLISVNELLNEENSHVKLKSRIFAQGLKLPNNLAPLPPAILFQTGTLPIYTCALKYYPNGKMEMVFLEPNATSFLAKTLQGEKEYRHQPKEEGNPFFDQPRDFRLLLVDPHTGIVKQGADEIEETQLLQDPEYIKLCAQAKFYNGDLNSYTKIEMKYLEEWILENGIDQMRTLLSHILRARPNDRERFKSSKLGYLFGRLSEAHAL